MATRVMTISIKTLSLFALTISLTIAIPNAGFTQDTNTPPAKEKPSKKAAKAEPKAEPKAVTFSAKIAAVDKVARTITLDDRAKHVLQISSDTLITKDGKPANGVGKGARLVPPEETIIEEKNVIAE